MKMDVYALNSERVEDFEKMMRNLEVVGTEKDFINYGFTNYDPPYLYFMRYVKQKDRDIVWNNDNKKDNEN